MLPVRCGVFFPTPNHMVSILIWHKKSQCCISPGLISYDLFLKLHCRHLFSRCFYPHCSWAPALDRATREWCENTTPTAWHWVWWNNLFEATLIMSDSEVPGVEIRAKGAEDRGDSEVEKKHEFWKSWRLKTPQKKVWLSTEMLKFWQWSLRKFVGNIEVWEAAVSDVATWTNCVNFLLRCRTRFRKRL